MSGPNPPDYEPGGQPTEEYRDELTDTGFSRAYSAPESEQYAIAPYIPAELDLYDYDSYDRAGDAADDEHHGLPGRDDLRRKPQIPRNRRAENGQKIEGGTPAEKLRDAKANHCAPSCGIKT